MATYDITITKEINKTKLYSEITIQINTFTGFWNNNQDYTFDFNGTFDNLLLEQIVLNHDPIDLIDDEYDKYTKRIEDGQNISSELMAELRIKSIEEVLPRAVNMYIETKLEKVKLNLDRGWWITAQEELILVTVESYLTQELYDRISVYISDYIALSYAPNY